MAWLSLYLEAPHALGDLPPGHRAAIGLQGPDEERTLTQLRAVVVADYLLDAAAGGATNRNAQYSDLDHTTAGQPTGTPAPTTWPTYARNTTNSNTTPGGRSARPTTAS
jgi:hypothetical protein